MKTLILLLTLLFSANLISQNQNNTDAINRYLQKSNTKKKTANALLLTGTGLILTGVVIASTGNKNNGVMFFSPTQIAGFGISTLGVFSALTSVPFYISAAHNKSKYRKISPQLGSFNANENNYFTAGVKLEF